MLQQWAYNDLLGWISQAALENKTLVPDCSNPKLNWEKLRVYSVASGMDYLNYTLSVATQKPPQVLGLEQAALGGATDVPHQSNVPMVANKYVMLFCMLLNKINKKEGLATGISWLGCFTLGEKAAWWRLAHPELPHPKGPWWNAAWDCSGRRRVICRTAEIALVGDLAGGQTHPLRRGGSYLMKSCDPALSLIVPNKLLSCCLNTLLSKPDGSGTEMTSRRHAAGKFGLGSLCN